MDSFISFISGILSSGIPCVLLALGIFITFRILNSADMSAEGSILIGMALCALCIKSGVPVISNPFFATFMGMIGGCLVGALTGFLWRVLKIHPLISGIISLTAAAPIATIIMGAAEGKGNPFVSMVSIMNEETIFSLFNKSVLYPWKEVVEVAVMAVLTMIVIFVYYFFFGTEYGMAIRTAGKNEKMASSQGINTSLASFVAIVISNGIIGLAGALLLQHNKSVSITSATGYLVVGLAAIIMGEAIFGKRNFKNQLISISLGAILYFLIVKVALQLGFPGELNQLLYAVLIVIAICLPSIKKGCVKLFKKIFRKGVNENARA